MFDSFVACDGQHLVACGPAGFHRNFRMVTASSRPNVSRRHACAQRENPYSAVRKIFFCIFVLHARSIRPNALRVNKNIKKNTRNVVRQRALRYTAKKNKILICIVLRSTLYSKRSALRPSLRSPALARIVHNPGHYKSFAGHYKSQVDLTCRILKLKIRGRGLYLLISRGPWDGSPLTSVPL